MNDRMKKMMDTCCSDGKPDMEAMRAFMKEGCCPEACGPDDDKKNAETTNGCDGGNAGEKGV